jgi:ABC-type transport system involved in multi-copper enzyme maturation permease subunit
VIHLLYIEFLKLKRNVPFLVLVALFAASVFGVNHAVEEISSGNARLGQALPFTFPDAWRSVAYFTSYLLVIPAVALVMHACAENTYRTSRQNVIDGLGRDQYVTGKVLVALSLALLATLLAGAAALVTGKTGVEPFSLAGIEYIFYFFLHAVMFLGAALLLALLLGRSAITIGVLVVYWLFAENVLEKYLVKLGAAGQLLPFGSSEHLLQLDAYRLARVDETLPVAVYIAAAVAYVVACYAACYWRFRRQDP